MSAQDVVTQAIKGELGLILALASLRTDMPLSEVQEIPASTAEVVMQALTDAGYAVVELPEYEAVES
ncbi:hypothetical protein [Tsukamurella soli]|uniref:hypothetical protein n=1 Tax=Tsukamurella soli TaxID=644556 RepID=UPI0031E83399